MTYDNIDAIEISIGENTIIEPSATIRGINGKAKKIKIGDNCYIGENVQIICDDFYLGDYSKIQHHTNVHGYLPCHIGHNAWIGQYSIIDSIGGMTIGNNCGVGAHSQLWSHVKFGDTLEGSRFLSDKPMVIEDDVWFIGHCIVSPIHAKSKSMVLAGSVVTKDLEHNHIYAGSPAKSISEKVGYQFLEVSAKEKMIKLKEYLNEWNSKCESIKIVFDIEEAHVKDDFYTYFAINTRSYTKRLSDEEIGFMKYLLPDKAKFIPHIL